MMSKSYFWVSVNPKIWSVDDIRYGKKEFFIADDGKGVRRRIFSAFKIAEQGDRVLFYETSPVKAIVAEGVVEEGLHEKIGDGGIYITGISIRHIRDIGPIPFDTIKTVDFLRNTPPIKPGTQQGTIFKLTEDEFFEILELSTIEKRLERLQEQAIQILEKQLYGKNKDLQVQAAGRILNIKHIGVPKFRKDRVYDEHIQKNYSDLFDLNFGGIIGKVMARNGNVVILLQIGPGKTDYSQDMFERDLKKLLQKLREIKEGLGLSNISIVFKAGGIYQLPEWFIGYCHELDIKIIFVENDEVVREDMKDD